MTEAGKDRTPARVAAEPAAPLHLTADGRLDAPALLHDRRLQRVLAALAAPGEETRIVGGAVRNALIGLPPGDVDLATTLESEAVMAMGKAARLRVVPTGISHGTVTIVADGLPFEVTTLREDVETDGRRAVVRFGRDFARDAERRDFTVNALSAAPDGRLFDTVGGVADLGRGRIRFIGDPSTRIREDVLRILRFFRFSATYGRGALDPDGLAACIALRDSMASLSRERVRAELIKLLASPRAAEVLAVMDAGGLIAPVLGGPADLHRLQSLAPGPSVAADPLLRLAALAVRRPDDAQRLQDRLRLSNAETARLAAAASAAADCGGTEQAPEAGRIRRCLFEHGRAATLDGLALARATLAVPSSDPSWTAAETLAAALPEPRLPFTGGDLVRRGLSGPAVGAALGRLRNSWIDAGFPDDPATLARLADAAVQ